MIVDFGQNNYNAKLRKMVFKRFLADRQQSKDLQLKEDKGLKGTKKNIDELMNEKERFKEIKQ